MPGYGILKWSHHLYTEICKYFFFQSLFCKWHTLCPSKSLWGNSWILKVLVETSINLSKPRWAGGAGRRGYNLWNRRGRGAGDSLYINILRNLFVFALICIYIGSRIFRRPSATVRAPSPLYTLMKTLNIGNDTLFILAIFTFRLLKWKATGINISGSHDKPFQRLSTYLYLQRSCWCLLWSWKAANEHTVHLVVSDDCPPWTPTTPAVLLARCLP